MRLSHSIKIYMKNKNLKIKIIICLISLIILFIGYILLQQISPENSQEIDCTALKERFDHYVERRYLPINENTESLCYGLYVGYNFSTLTPKWAIGELIAIRGSRLTFEGILQDATIPMGLTDAEAAKYHVGKNYKIDMNNICRDFFMMADSYYPSPISATFIKPEEITCE